MLGTATVSALIPAHGGCGWREDGLAVPTPEPLSTTESLEVTHRQSSTYGFLAVIPGGLKLSIPVTVIPLSVPVADVNSRKPRLTGFLSL